MEFDAILLPPRRAAAIADGLWLGKTINDALDEGLRECPDKTALIAVSDEAGETRRVSYRELARLADRAALGLARLGVGRGDVVAMQLPNGWPFTLTYLACSRIGAVLNPLMPIFRARELGFMLKHGRAKIAIVPKRFRGFDHEAMLAGLRDSLPDLEHVIVVGGDFDQKLTEPRWEDEPGAAERLARDRPGPDDITQLIYTSGTTGEPKGVMHSANTLFSNIATYAERLRLDANDVVLMASPMAHQTGFMYGLMMPIALRATALLLDVWSPKRAVELIRAEGATFTMASTPFLTDLARAVEESGTPVPTLRTFLCAGAPIPGPLVEYARKALGAKIVSAWGMTENGAVTLIHLDDDDERAFNTSGCPLPGVEIRAVEASGAPTPAGVEGRLLVRSCSNFGGYLLRPQWNATDAEGWFDTGDLAVIDSRGYVRITGRSKDVIIRGGENIPVVEVETLLYKHPAIAQVAIVAYPDARLGERACAVVVLKPGQTLTLAEMTAFLEARDMARQYWPERLLIRDQMPATPSGKIQKFRLREMVRETPWPRSPIAAASTNKRSLS
jgi:cyclohexanecarboxylate-CoA ligase